MLERAASIIPLWGLVMLIIVCCINIALGVVAALEPHFPRFNLYVGAAMLPLLVFFVSVTAAKLTNR